MWLCKCDCGNERIVNGYSLRTGATVSCGCYSRDKTIQRNIRHGQAGTRLYVIWKNMKKRCFKPQDKKYPRYGGRGITICEAWLEFGPFYEWAMASGYQDNLTIDRIDNDKGYSPENCRWASKTEQANNTCRNAYVTVLGQTHSVAEWARITGIPWEQLYSKYLIFARAVHAGAKLTTPDEDCTKRGEHSA